MLFIVNMLFIVILLLCYLLWLAQRALVESVYEKWNRPDPTRPGPTARLPALRTPDLGPPVLTPFGSGRATVTQILRFARATLAPFAHSASGRATVTQILRIRRATLAPFAHFASGRATVTQISCLCASLCGGSLWAEWPATLLVITLL